jgi:hypothetical protein
MLARGSGSSFCKVQSRRATRDHASSDPTSSGHLPREGVGRIALLNPAIPADGAIFLSRTRNQDLRFKQRRQIETKENAVSVLAAMMDIKRFGLFARSLREGEPDE